MMDFKYIIPDMKTMFGELEFGSFVKDINKRLRGQILEDRKEYEIFSSVQRRGIITVRLPYKASVEDIDYGDRIELINPTVIGVTEKRRNYIAVGYILQADGIKKIEENKERKEVINYGNEFRLCST